MQVGGGHLLGGGYFAGGELEEEPTPDPADQDIDGSLVLVAEDPEVFAIAEDPAITLLTEAPEVTATADEPAVTTEASDPEITLSVEEFLFTLEVVDTEVTATFPLEDHMTTLKIKQGDTHKPVEAVIQDSDGAIDLTNASSVRFIMSTPAGGTVVDAAGTIVAPATDGRVRYAWAEGDTDTAGNYRAEFEVTFADGTILTAPTDKYLKIRILSQLG